MDWAWEQWKKNEYPGHHLWGATHLHQYGIHVDILRHEKYSFLKKISSKIKVLGDLDQQLRLLLKEPDYDLVFCAHDLSTSLLAFLRSIGLFKKPIVIVMHRSFKETLWSKIFVETFIKRHDKFICLSPIIMENFRDRFKVPEEKLSFLEWGVDLSFYQKKQSNFLDEIKKENEPPFFISAGKTGRDYNTLAKAFCEISYPLKIYCSGDVAPTIPNITSNIILQNKSSTEKNFLSLDDLLKEYEKAFAVAIPLDIPLERVDTVTQIGITSLLEAMAMGKAVVMTRNRQIELDIEEEGIGIFVEPGDVKGWKEAVSYLINHPQETKEMGNRARCLCKSRYDLDDFSSKLADILKSIKL